MAVLGEPEILAILLGDLDPDLPPAVRDAMLDLILAFAEFDAAASFVTAYCRGLNPREGADFVGKKGIKEKLRLAAAALRGTGREADAILMSTVRDQYEDRSCIRNRIAHSKCAGVRRSDPSRIIFMPYEGEGDGDMLAIEICGLEALREDEAWARQMTAAFEAIVEAAGFFNVPSAPN